MAFNEQEYITLCKRQIEKKFAFGNGNGYTQRDLECLAKHIEDKTGIILSLSTLKRFWKGNFKQRPQQATLNALAAVLDYSDWQEFKLQNKPPDKHSRLKRPWVLAVIVLTATIATAVFALNIPKKAIRPNSPKVNGPVYFSTQKTVTSGIPNTVVFNYDLSHVEADSFFIQQSWNDFHKVTIDPNGTAYTSIYFESGYHRARLIANDSMIAMQPVHILSEGWEPHIYYSYEDKEPINLKNDRFIADGQLHMSKELLGKRNVDFSRYFFSRISNSREFNVSSDHFSIHTRMKVDSLTDKLCPWMQVIVVTEKHIFWVNLQNKGCERYASYKTGELVRFGENNDLSALGVNVYDWQEVGMTVENKHAEISINGDMVFQQTFKQDFGKVMGLIYLFVGTGSIDSVRMADSSGETVFEDDFTRIVQ